MKILTAEQMQAVDRLTTDRCGVPGLLLMENAGGALLEVLRGYFEDPEELQTVILCGPGNNGGDGLVLARRLLQEGGWPTVVLAAEAGRVRGDAATQLAAVLGWEANFVEVTGEDDWKQVVGVLDDADIVVDGLLGTGLNKPLEGLFARIVEDINESAAFVLSIDIPSGMSSDAIEPAPLSVRADATVTFTAPKIAHVLNLDAEALGELHVAPIGTPPALLDGQDFTLELLEQERVATWLPPRPAAAHKGTFGHVAVIAGGPGKGGAAALAGQAALRAGAGLVTVLSAPSVLPVVVAARPELMSSPLRMDGDVIAAGAADAVLEELEQRTAAALGPGMGTAPETAEFIRRVVEKRPCPLVLDADGLNVMAGELESLQSRDRPPLILTPHPGEFARLSGVSAAEVLRDQLRLTADFATRYGVWIVLKTFRPLITTPDGRQLVSPRGNSGMATAGTGDCLTGVLAAQLALEPGDSGVDWVTEAVARSVFVHGLAGDLAAARRSPVSLTAGDLVDALGDAFRRLESGE